MTPKFLWPLVCGKSSEFSKLISDLKKFLAEILEKRRNQLKNKENDNDWSRDLLAILIEARNNGDFTSDEEVIDEILLFFVSFYLIRMVF